MSDDHHRRDRLEQPMDQRMIPTGSLSLRDFIMVEVGKLQEGQRRGAEDRATFARKLDEIATDARNTALAAEHAAGKRELQEKIVLDLARIIGDEDGGLIKQVKELEKRQAASRNVAIGIGIGSGLAGAGSWAGITALLRKWGF